MAGHVPPRSVDGSASYRVDGEEKAAILGGIQAVNAALKARYPQTRGDTIAALGVVATCAAALARHLRIDRARFLAYMGDTFDDLAPISERCTCSYDDSEEMTGHAALCPMREGA